MGLVGTQLPMFGQLSLFDQDEPKEKPLRFLHPSIPGLSIAVPAVIEKALRMNAALSVSISAGKDSQAMVEMAVALHRSEGYTGPLYNIHADVGVMEWTESLPHCQWMSEHYGLELVVVRRPQGDLLDRIRQRLEATRGKAPPWPSPAARYCQGELKDAQIDKHMRCHNLVISAVGIRAEESTNRAKKPLVSVRKDITAKRLHELTPDEALEAWNPEKERLAFTWNTILDWLLPDVWTACGTSVEEVDHRRMLYQEGSKEEALRGRTIHPCYIYGNTRCSCVFCVMASLNDLSVGARMRPDLLQVLIDLEDESGYTFQNGRSLRMFLDQK